MTSTPPNTLDVRAQAERARAASRDLNALDTPTRADLIERMARALIAHTPRIIAANQRDLASAKPALESGEMSSALYERLGITAERIASLADGLMAIARAPEPLGKTLEHRQLGDGVTLERVTSPLGVLLVIFEARPDAMPQIAALAMRAGNGVVLKGGTEAKHSNRAIHDVLTSAIAPVVSPDVLAMVETREHIADLLALHDVIDLVIPRGSNALVSHIQQNTRIPVLGHADGVCHVYVDEDASRALAIDVVTDSKVDYPAACNALETLLIHRAWPHTPELLEHLRSQGVRLHTIAEQAKELGVERVTSTLHHEWGDLDLTVVVVDDMPVAIDHIHQHGSGHTEAILTSDAERAAQFLNQVDSASVFHNVSTRFADGYRYGLGAEVGVSTSRIHARGPVGLDGLLTSRWLVRGDGHTVGAVRRGEWAFDWKELK